MIEAHGLTKRYGGKTAVENLSFAVRPGIVAGFLGPNGAGKSTTIRMILGLDTPSDGPLGHRLPGPLDRARTVRRVHGAGYRDRRGPEAADG
jgi:ABC-type multidrug transport system ATPase subunit